MYTSLHKQLRRHLPNPFRELPCMWNGRWTGSDSDKPKHFSNVRVYICIYFQSRALVLSGPNKCSSYLGALFPSGRAKDICHNNE